MGIKNLYKLIEENAPDSITEHKISHYKNKIIVLDASMIIYQFVIAIRSTGSDLKNNEGKMTTHIVGVINKALMMLKNGLTPVFVFDGKPPESKYETLKGRKDKKDKILENLAINEYENELDRIKDFKRSFTISKNMIEEVKEILTLFGIPIFEGESEADPYCAVISKLKNVYGVASEDMDLLTFGSPILLRNLSGTKLIKEINLNKVLKGLDLTYKEFVDLCILLGCDYSATIPKIGKKRALEMIKKYKTIEEMLKNETGLKIPEKFNYKIAREIFMYDYKVKSLKLSLKKPSYNKIKDIMINKYNISSTKVNDYIKKIKFAYGDSKEGGYFNKFVKNNC